MSGQVCTRGSVSSVEALSTIISSEFGRCPFAALRQESMTRAELYVTTTTDNAGVGGEVIAFVSAVRPLLSIPAAESHRAKRSHQKFQCRLRPRPRYSVTRSTPLDAVPEVNVPPGAHRHGMAVTFSPARRRAMTTSVPFHTTMLPHAAPAAPVMPNGGMRITPSKTFVASPRAIPTDATRS